MTAVADEGFELYDLRVEVVAPAGATLFCGAKAGDYFELRGEMLHLPPGQAMSIYSIAAVLPLLPAKQRATDPLTRRQRPFPCTGSLASDGRRARGTESRL